MKKLILSTFTFMVVVVAPSSAVDNYLNSVILEGTGSGSYNIILRSDAIAMAKKTVESPDKISLSIRGITASDDIATIYRNTSAADGVIVENVGSNEVKVQVHGENISKANIIFESPASAPVVVTDGVSHKALAWSIVALLVLCVIFAKSRNIKVDSNEKIIAAVQKNVRDREIAMYKNYRKEFLHHPRIDSKITSPRMKQVIRRADTIRHLQKISRV